MAQWISSVLFVGTQILYLATPWRKFLFPSTTVCKSPWKNGSVSPSCFYYKVGAVLCRPSTINHSSWETQSAPAMTHLEGSSPSDPPHALPALAFFLLPIPLDPESWRGWTRCLFYGWAFSSHLFLIAWVSRVTADYHIKKNLTKADRNINLWA